MEIHIITMHEHDDYCGIGGANFTPEAYTDKSIADARLEQLEKELGKYSGFYYTMDTTELNKPQN